mgnify:FL=1
MWFRSFRFQVVFTFAFTRFIRTRRVAPHFAQSLRSTAFYPGNYVRGSAPPLRRHKTYNVDIKGKQATCVDLRKTGARM